MAGALAKKAGGGRGRRWRRRRSLNAEINVTPFVDVMLVLLIIFMVAAPLLTVGVQVDLPDTEAKALNADDEPLTLSIRADGAIFLQETPIAFGELAPRLEAVARAGYEQRIFIRADQTADYGVVAQVMARINAAGYRNIGLVTDPLEQ
jgi:biopolymer transport protein TolR